MITPDLMRKMWPRAPLPAVQKICAVAEEVFADCHLNSPLRVAHFMAQISHECGAGTIVRENMNYSADRLMQIFGVGRHSAKITQAEAALLAHRPEQIAERVYGLGNPSKARELGNTQPGDGYRFRGNGMLQLTGRASHRRIGEQTGYDLEDQPQQLEDAAISFRVAAAEFVALNCLPAADADDVALVTRRVNGGRNGLSERTVWLRKWKECLDGIDAPPQRPRGAPPAEAKPLMSSRIAQSTVIGGGVTAVGTVSQIANLAQTANEQVSTIKGAADNTAQIVQTVKPILGMPPSVWVAIGIGCGVLGLAAMGWTLFERWRKLRDQGV